MANKPDDTQALSKQEIQDAGINYRPRQRNQQPQQTPQNTTAVMITFLVMLGFVLVSAIIGAVIVILNH